MRGLLILMLGVVALAGCAPVTSPENPPSDPVERAEYYDRLRREQAERDRLCRTIDRDSDRYDLYCRQSGD